MGVLKTAEVRWFREGALPPAVVDWYVQGQSRGDAERLRADTYLLVGGTDALGIKLREGRIEVKQRYGQPSSVQLSPVAAGYIETWHKWSFVLAAPEKNGLIPDDGGAWITVHKARTVQTFGVSRKGVIVPLAGSVAPNRGCSVELAQVTVEDRLWWSFAFEAVGEESALTDILVSVAHYVLEGADVLQLGAEESYGYPRWLQLAVPYLSSFNM